MTEVKATTENELFNSSDSMGADNYVNNLFLMGSPLPVLLIWVSYMFFVLKCGPKFMENRPAYKLRNLLIIYNALQVAFASYIFLLGIRGFMDYGIVEREYCVYENNDDKEKHRLFNAHHLYFLVKLTELLDTVFFVLRKKWNQITFLHIYHHSAMFLVTWLGLKYEPTYAVTFLGAINSFVHIIMYTYYGLSAFPGLEKYLWWKKYITMLQLGQFSIIGIQIIWNWSVTACPVSYILLSTVAGNLVFFIYLFTDFYLKSYSKNVEEKKENELKKQ